MNRYRAFSSARQLGHGVFAPSLPAFLLPIPCPYPVAGTPPPPIPQKPGCETVKLRAANNPFAINHIQNSPKRLHSFTETVKLWTVRNSSKNQLLTGTRSTAPKCLFDFFEFF